VRAHLVRLNGGRVIIAVERDISAQKRVDEENRLLETQLQRAQKLESLGVLAGGIAHDFNNLLMTMRGALDLALRNLPTDASAREGIMQVQRSARRATDLTSQLLACSGKGRFVVEDIDLNRVIEGMRQLLRSAVPKMIRLQYDLRTELPAIRADATQIQQIVMNLALNGAEAIGDRRGRLSVATRSIAATRPLLRRARLGEDLPEGPYVVLEVTDTGQGMDERTREFLFEPFFTTKFSGRGLGLAAVHGIVCGHHGGITVDTDPLHGTTFAVLLPALEHSVPWDEVHEPESPECDWRSSGVILVVDDEKDVREVVQNMLEWLGFTVLLAAHGGEAVTIFRQHQSSIDCVLLDFTMPEMDGAETYGELRRLECDVPVILSSGFPEQEAVEKFVGAELAGFLQKPYEVPDLVAKLREVLGPRSSG